MLAGAGSGKTRVITKKISQLITRGLYSPDSIAAVTFTNKAASEMRERAAGLLGETHAKSITVSTFHTLGLRILRKECGKIRYKRNFTIFDADDSRLLLAEIIKQEDQQLINAVEYAQRKISNLKNGLISPKQAMADAVEPDDMRIAQIYRVYERSLHAYNAFDFDDLIKKPVELFNDNADVLQRWRDRLHYFLVDEYQDTNVAQYELLKSLAGPAGHFTIVGDDDQSIYSWRGAQPQNIVRLQQDYPKLKVIKLEQNYRSTSRILKAANQLISVNAHLFEKRLWSAAGDGEPIQVMICRDGQEEANRVADEIVHHRLHNAAAWSDYAILYRGNHQSRLFEKALRERRIPYYLSGGTSFFDRAEVKDIVAYLRLLINPDDDAAFLRVVNVPRREIGSTTLEKLGAYANHHHCSLFTAIYEDGADEHIGKRTYPRLREFADWLVRQGKSAEQGDPLQVARELVQEIDYESWLREVSRDSDIASRRWENVGDLFDWMANLQATETDSKSLGDLLAHMSLMDMLDKNSKEKDSDKVCLMTLHAAKGLEFPHVFIVSVEEEILPHRNSVTEEAIEEERRLIYVGITRAMRTLCLSYAEKRKYYGDMRECEPSRFLSELPMEHLNWRGGESDLSPEQQQEKAKASLSALKGLLAET
ncbi:MAG: UvrD-helicase domain-containing protein [Gammaproteobacteria bacterium]|nr:UvrD-helicase domain-containing protein [Gammaproteobacteria bacterium]